MRHDNDVPPVLLLALALGVMFAGLCAVCITGVDVMVRAARRAVGG